MRRQALWAAAASRWRCCDVHNASRFVKWSRRPSIVGTMTRLFRLPLIAATLMMALGAAPHALAQTADTVEVRILAINDFHGNLTPPPGGIRIDDQSDRAKKITIPAGGAETMASVVKRLREGHKNTVFVAAGDLIGASPFLSAMFHDEPTIESLSMMGLQISDVGNHEFAEGKDQLLS